MPLVSGLFGKQVGNCLDAGDQLEIDNLSSSPFLIRFARNQESR